MLLSSFSPLAAIGFLTAAHILSDGWERANARRGRTLLSGDIHRFDANGDLRPLAQSGKAILSDEMLSRLSNQESNAIVAHQLSFAKVSGLGAFLCAAAYGFIAIIAKGHLLIALSIGLLVHTIGLTALIGWFRKEADQEAVRRTGDPQALITAILKIHGTRSWLAAGRVSRIAKAGRIPSADVARLARGRD
jgi:hypothetical protein